MFTTFIDERVKTNKFLLVMFCIQTKDIPLIENTFKLFLSANKYPFSIEFHYFKNSPKTRKLFIEFISRLPIIKIYKYTHPLKSYKTLYNDAFDEILKLYNFDYPSYSITPFMDQTSGEKMEQFLRKSFNFSAKKHNITLTKPLRFLPSHKSIFIQIADYLAAITL